MVRPSRSSPEVFAHRGARQASCSTNALGEGGPTGHGPLIQCERVRWVNTEESVGALGYPGA